MQTIEASAVQSGRSLKLHHLRSSLLVWTSQAAWSLAGAAETIDKDYESFDQHQASAARLDFAEEARSLLDIAR